MKSHMPRGCLPVKRIANQEIDADDGADRCRRREPMIAAGMIQRNRRPLVSRLADFLVRDLAAHRNVAGVGPERRVLVEQKADVPEHPAVVAEPALLQVPDPFVALAGEQR